MRDKTSSGEAAWQEEELSTAGPSRQAFGPSVATVAGSDVSCAGQPIPAACGDWAAAKAAYRFFDNPRVTEHGVLEAISPRPRRGRGERRSDPYS
ncbi:transposase DNA-binding-containing protein, partial [Mesorhizobium sp. M0408]|uniref:transposase DNA-binding-containing protein n=1 Tax=Mesorhizobium sp. M0408 TaxID=2956942 RepID=UPI003336EAB7